MASLSALGFCGADDSVHPDQLAILHAAYPTVEFGVLLRPDKEGTPRYASPRWLERLHAVKKSSRMRLAAHLCGSRVNEILSGDTDYLASVVVPTFERVQINATAVNGVDTSRLADAVPVLWDVIKKFPSTQFILQRNEETEVLCAGIQTLLAESRVVDNVAMLFDESKGTGVLSSSWPVPNSALYKTGYAGGIGPANITSVLEGVMKAVNAGEHSKEFWIDMESSLRSIKNEVDVFDLEKCYEVIEAICKVRLMKKPAYLTCR